MPVHRRRPPWLKILLLTGGGVAATLLVAVFLLARPFPEPAWVEAPRNDLSLYAGDDPGDLPVVSPLHLEIQPMESLLLVNFEGDPDRVYRGLEPQAFDDEVHGRGFLVIGWRVDGRVDVFHDPSLRLDPETYGITGAGLHAMVPRDLGAATLAFGPSGVHADFDFEDLEGRRVRLVVRESDTRPRRPFSLLAPMGTEAADPPALPLVYVKEFYFVRRAGSEIRIEFDGRAHRSDALPLVLDGTRMHFVRYSTRPLIGLWNPSPGARARVVEVEPDLPRARDAVEVDGVRLDLVANGPFREIRSMSRSLGGDELTVAFEPALPHLLALAEGARATGVFRITTRPPAGVVGGVWEVERQGDRILLQATPSEGWTPGEAPPMARLLFRAVSMFRTWPATYRWSAFFDLPSPDAELEGWLPLQSTWERIEAVR